ncbi:MAG: M48 family metallopeptidase [Coriobacteriales bacterium]|nr:M48 family metallopeptidase [Coriobacteriales bacterium]
MAHIKTITKAEAVFDYTLKRSQRKTIALYVRNGAVEVRAPMGTSPAEIDRFVASKNDWIAKRLSSWTAKREQRREFTLDYGSGVVFRGHTYPLVAKEGSRAGFDSSGFFIPPDLSPPQIKASCQRIYRLLAKRYLTKRTHDLAQYMDVALPEIWITGAKTRWGSCSVRAGVRPGTCSDVRIDRWTHTHTQQGTATDREPPRPRICYSWRLIMADDEVIDYVVVHELAHLLEMNHSTRFWNIVGDILPDYRERKKRLKALHERLDNEDWG